MQQLIERALERSRRLAREQAWLVLVDERARFGRGGGGVAGAGDSPELGRVAAERVGEVGEACERQQDCVRRGEGEVSSLVSGRLSGESSARARAEGRTRDGDPAVAQDRVELAHAAHRPVCAQHCESESGLVLLRR